ncbi:hypothetical protein SCA6_007372 [Theobroma cacao]
MFHLIYGDAKVWKIFLRSPYYYGIEEIAQTSQKGRQWTSGRIKPCHHIIPDQFPLRYTYLLSSNFVNEYLSKCLGYGMNESFITLIPKKRNPSSIGDYKSNSLVGGINKLIAKLLAIRLRKVVGR